MLSAAELSSPKPTLVVIAVVHFLHTHQLLLLVPTIVVHIQLIPATTDATGGNLALTTSIYSAYADHESMKGH